MKTTKSTARKIKALKVKAEQLKKDFEFAQERTEATIKAHLTQHGMASRMESWDRKRNELGVAYYTLLEQIADLEYPA